MLRFEKHIINGLYQNITLSQSYVSLCQKSAFSFVNRRKGLTKHERAVHVTAEFFDRLAEKQDAQEKKRLKRKGIEVTDETPITPAQQFARNMIEKIREDPIKFFSDDNLVFDKERGLIGRKDVIGDVEKFVQSQEWKDLEAAEREEEEKEQKQQLKKSTKKETKVNKEEEGDNSEGLFDEWEQDPSREKLSHSEDGGGRKVKKQQTMLEKQEAKKQESKKPKFKDIFRQFSDEPLDQIESGKQVEEIKQQDYSNKENIRKREEEKGQKSRPARDSLEDSQAFGNKDKFDRAERTEERNKRNKKSARFEEEDNFNENEQDIFENIAEHRKGPETRKEFQSNKDVERKPKERKESQKSNESFQSFLDEFAAEPIGDLKSKKASNKTDPEEEEDEFFLEDIDKFDQPAPKRNIKADNRDREVKTQQKPPAKNNLQQFYSDLSEEKVQKIQRRLEIDDNVRNQAQDEYIGQSQRQSSQITNYETFKKSLEKRKSLERFYFFLRKFDTDNLIKILSYPNLIDKNPTEQIPKFLILLNYIRKNKLLQNYDREDIHKVLEKIISHINDLRYTEVSTLAVLLDQMRISRADYFREIEKRVIEDAEKFSIRTLSNIIYSFGRISTKQSITEDFSELFAKMETIIALRVKNMNGKDISQVMVGYSKSQNFSPELLYVLEQACLEKYDTMQTKELSVIAHTFAKNDHFSADFFDKLKVTLMRDGGKFKMMELALVMEALEKFKLIDQSVLKELERQFARRADQSNIQDIAIFFKVLTRPDYRMAEATAAKMSEVCNMLFNNIDANCLYKMFNNFAEKFDKGNIKRDMAELMIRRFKMLIKTNAIRGIHFTEIKTELFKVKDENIVRRSKKALQEEFAKKDTRKSDNRRQNNPEEY